MSCRPHFRSFHKSPKSLNSLPNKVALVGHADSIPIHNKRFQSNWELSAARSVNLLEVLSSRYGISESRLSVQSYWLLRPEEFELRPKPDGPKIVRVEIFAAGRIRSVVFWEQCCRERNFL